MDEGDFSAEVSAERQPARQTSPLLLAAHLMLVFNSCWIEAERRLHDNLPPPPRHKKSIILAFLFFFNKYLYQGKREKREGEMLRLICEEQG